MSGFTMVTDGGAVAARFANASVSIDMHVAEEKWMRCLAHYLGNMMKSSAASHSDSSIL